MDPLEQGEYVQLLKRRFAKRFPDKKPMSDFEARFIIGGASKGFIKDLVKEFKP